jgi:hypothetical protein
MVWLTIRALYYKTSHAGLCSDGNIPQPREIPLVQVRMLFDQIPEFGTRVLKVMRQSMDGTCSLSTLQKGG